ncbi:MAG TPA: efflux RND transporter periplasmic adaptor subunit [Kofleriaceae bacterium]
MENDQLSRDLASLKIDRSAPRSAGRSRVAWTLGIVGALAAIGYLVVYPRVHEALTTPQIELAEIELVSPSQGDVDVTATGYVIALTSAKVASKVAGRISELYVDMGSVLKQGDKVARVDDTEFRGQLASARARSAAAHSKIAIARGQLAEIKVQIDRETPMVASGVSAPATLADLRTRYDSLGAAVKAAEADAIAADADTASLNTQLESYMIYSPISGTVVNKLVQVGEGVSPGFGTPGVVEVVDMTSLVVEVDVPETKLDQIEVGGQCEIVLDAYATKRFQGTVKEIVQRVNRSKATVPVRVAFDNRPERALPDMAARVSFLAKKLDAKAFEAPAKLVVPAAAVVQRGGSDVVFEYDDGDVRMTQVKVGPVEGDSREVLSKIPAGTKVVVSPPASLADGQKVKEKK